MCTENMGTLAQNIANNDNGGLNYIQKSGLGLQTAGVIANAFSSMQEAKAMSEYSIKQTEATLANYTYQTQALKNRYSEELESLAQGKQNTYLENLKAHATALTSAAGNGIEGSSIDSLLIGYERATAINNYLTDKEMRLKGLQVSDDADALRIQAINSLNNQQQYTNKTASTLLTGLGSLVSSYSDSYMKSEYYKGKYNGISK